MAKWGEGDTQWIAEKRQDATNVNNWHWSEKNATPWSKDRLKELLEGLKFEDGSASVELTTIKKMEGEATANNRKAKLIFLFEWELEVNFVGRMAGSEDEVKGHVEISNLSDENDAEVVDVNTTITTKSPDEAAIRHLVNKKGVEAVRAALAVYILDLKEECSKELILPNDTPNEQALPPTTTTTVATTTTTPSTTTVRLSTTTTVPAHPLLLDPEPVEAPIETDEEVDFISQFARQTEEDVMDEDQLARMVQELPLAREREGELLDKYVNKLRRVEELLESALEREKMLKTEVEREKRERMELEKNIAEYTLMHTSFEATHAADTLSLKTMIDGLVANVAEKEAELVKKSETHKVQMKRQTKGLKMMLIIMCAITAVLIIITVALAVGK